MSELKIYSHGNSTNPKFLVLILHGYGSNAENIIDLAFQFQPLISDGFFIAPNAIEKWEGGFPNSYQWFSLQNSHILSPHLAFKIHQANQTLKKFIDEQLKKFNLSYQNLILMGFSQGSMMSIYQGLILPNNIAGVVSFSGKVVEPTLVGDKIVSKPPICLIHGDKDSVLPYDNFIEAKKILSHHQIPFEAHTINGLDHTIDQRAIKIAQNFIQKIII